MDIKTICLIFISLYGIYKLIKDENYDTILITLKILNILEPICKLTGKRKIRLVIRMIKRIIEFYFTDRNKLEIIIDVIGSCSYLNN